MLGALIRRSGVCLLAGRSAAIRGSAVPIPQSLASKRWQCSKPEVTKSKNEGSPFKVPQHKPTEFERKVLVWGGQFKNDSDIPEFVTFQALDAAKNKARIKFSMLMMLMTILGCVVMVITGKKAAKQQETLTRRNLERKAHQNAESEK
ncbi:protein FAM162A-like [Eleutherodactylus coqui]|uniref:protein FAM162A-like n=1 Tax=Eleutherodactylus coqui TaxID=57060 RepID=UPI003462E729